MNLDLSIIIPFAITFPIALQIRILIEGLSAVTFSKTASFLRKFYLFQFSATKICSTYSCSNRMKVPKFNCAPGKHGIEYEELQNPRIDIYEVTSDHFWYSDVVFVCTTFCAPSLCLGINNLLYTENNILIPNAYAVHTFLSIYCSEDTL